MIAIGFEQFEPKGEILRELNALQEMGTIRLIDAQFVRKSEAGQITSMEMSGLNEEEAIEFGAVIGGLIGAGVGGTVGAVEGAVEGALAAVEHSYGMSMEDVQNVADGLAPGDAAALLLVEHTWAKRFSGAVRNAGGRTLAQGFLTPETLMLVGAELEAQAEAVAAIELSDAIKVEAAREAYRAVVLSEAIQQNAAQRAADSLVAAALIEEAAIEEASAVVATALAVEADALEEAAMVVAATDEMKQEASGEG